MSKKHFLIVDDDEKYHKLAKKIILKKCENSEIIHAYNGKEGLHYFLQNQKTINFIILDWEMPVMDGAEFLDFFLKNNLRLSLNSIKIIVFSAALIDDKIRKIQFSHHDLDLSFVRKDSSRAFYQMSNLFS